MDETDTIVAQAMKITKLETEVTTLLARARRAERQNEHHLTMRTQQEGIIATLRLRGGDK